MGNVRIKDLPAVSTAVDTDKMPVDSTVGTRGITIAVLSEGILNKLLSKTYDSLDTDAQTIPEAINELYSANISDDDHRPATEAQIGEVIIGNGLDVFPNGRIFVDTDEISATDEEITEMLEGTLGTI